MPLEPTLLEPSSYIRQFLSDLLQPQPTPQPAWWDQPLTIGSQLQGPKQGTNLDVGTPSQIVQDLIGGASYGSGNPSTIGGYTAASPGMSQGMAGALRSGVGGFLGGLGTGGLQGGLLGGLTNMGSTLAGGLGQNVSKSIFGSAPPAFSNAMTNAGLSPSIANPALSTMSTLASMLGPLGVLGVNGLNTGVAALQGKNISSNLAQLATGVPLGFLGPLGAIISKAISPPIAGLINYGYQGMTTGIDPNANRSWNAQEISNMTPGALESLNYDPATVADAMEGLAMQNYAKNMGFPSIPSMTTPAFSKQTSQVNTIADDLVASGWDRSFAESIDRATQNYSENYADRGWFDFSDRSDNGLESAGGSESETSTSDRETGGYSDTW